MPCTRALRQVGKVGEAAAHPQLCLPGHAPCQGAIKEELFLNLYTGIT